MVLGHTSAFSLRQEYMSLHEVCLHFVSVGVCLTGISLQELGKENEIIIGPGQQEGPSDAKREREKIDIEHLEQ